MPQIVSNFLGHFLCLKASDFVLNDRLKNKNPKIVDIHTINV